MHLLYKKRNPVDTKRPGFLLPEKGDNDEIFTGSHIDSFHFKPDKQSDFQQNN